MNGTVRVRKLTKRERLHSVMGQGGDDTHMAQVGPSDHRAVRAFGQDGAAAKASLIAKLTQNAVDGEPFIYTHAGHTIIVWRCYDGWNYTIVYPGDEGVRGSTCSRGGTREEAISAARLHLAQSLYDGANDGMAALATDQERMEHLSWVTFQDAWTILHEQGAAVVGGTTELAHELRGLIWPDYVAIYREKWMAT